MVFLTAAFAPMVAVCALPLTAVIAVVASVVANATARWVGLLMLVAAVVAMGYVAARVAANYDHFPREHSWRRWLPIGTTTVVVGSCLLEILSGSRAPDPIIVLWIAAVVWVVAFLPMASGRWGRARRALWVVGPAVTLVAIVFVWTQGFFAWRFARAVDGLDAIAQSSVAGASVPDGTHAGGFVVHLVHHGAVAGNPQCDVGLWITGWHEDDTRYIAHCNGVPVGAFDHLAGDWWQLENRTHAPDF